MTRSTLTLILLLALGALASCVPANDAGCAGWRPIRVAGPTVDYLASHDPETLKGLIGHHETGQRLGCWK